MMGAEGDIEAFLEQALGHQVPKRLKVFEDFINLLLRIKMENPDNIENYKDDKLIQTVIGTLKDPIPKIRGYSAYILELLKITEAIQPLLDCLKDYDPWVKEKILDAIGQMGDKKAFNSVVKLLKDKNKNVTISAARALGNIGEKGAVDPLLALINDEDKAVRKAVIRSLGNFDDPRITKILISSLQKEALEIIDEILMAFIDLGKNEVVEYTLPFISGANFVVRSAIFKKFGTPRENSGIKLLITFLKDENLELRNEAASKLISALPQAPESIIEELNNFYNHNILWNFSRIHQAQHSKDDSDWSFLFKFYEELLTLSETNQTLKKNFRDLLKALKKLCGLKKMRLAPSKSDREILDPLINSKIQVVMGEIGEKVEIEVMSESFHENEWDGPHTKKHYTNYLILDFKNPKLGPPLEKAIISNLKLRLTFNEYRYTYPNLALGDKITCLGWLRRNKWGFILYRISKLKKS